MDNVKQFQFDEIDLIILAEALGERIKSVRWNTERPDFEVLVNLRALQARIADQLNGGK